MSTDRLPHGRFPGRYAAGQLLALGLVLLLALPLLPLILLVIAWIRYRDRAGRDRAG